jgi:superfamily II DNA/RNA helicase
MIFTRTKRTAQKVSDELAERGFKVGAVHGDLGQIAREKSLKAFRTGEIDVLVATDVAARGIDIDDVTHVINYQIPEDEQAYVHRIGRTGRAGKTGVAVTLIDWDELERWSMINTALKLDRPDPAETYSNSPHFYEELGIPADAVGTIGGARKSSSPRPSRGDNRGDTRGDTRSETRGETRVSSTDRARSGSGDASRPSRNRSRQRTRSGENSSGHVENSSAAAASANPESSAAAGEGAARRRRRRRPRNAAEAGATPN